MSTTVLETLDAQMLDYQNDTDFSMHLSSSDTWAHEEASMEDDRRASPLENPNTSVEVDMELYDDEDQNPEYEMEDGSGSPNNDAVDVEVYDVTRAHSPDTVLGRKSPAPPANDFSHLPIAAESLEESSPNPIPYVASNLGSSDALTSRAQYPATSPDTQPIPASADIVEPDHSDDLVSQSKSPSAEVLLIDPSNSLDDEVPDVTASARDANSEEPQTATGTDDLQRVAEAPVLDVPTLEDAVAELPATNHQLAGQEDLSPSASTGDPHEISEGVYIDPPPAVLISFSTDLPAISLFNAPSGFSTKSPPEFEVADTTVLLGHLPTLYYEPLSSVFDALRQDEYIRNIPGLLNGEMILDAYELELAMSEDYTFAHEFSLHDLNVLHDGLNNTGPLRLRLNTVAPRFIDRYQSLQEQIAHLHISGEADGQVGGSREDDERTDEQEDEHPGQRDVLEDSDSVANHNRLDGDVSSINGSSVLEQPAEHGTEEGTGEPPEPIFGGSETSEHTSVSRHDDDNTPQESILVSTDLTVSASSNPVVENDENQEACGHRYQEQEDGDLHQVLHNEDNREESEEDATDTPFITAREYKDITDDPIHISQVAVVLGPALSEDLLTQTDHIGSGSLRHQSISNPQDESEEPDPQNVYLDHDIEGAENEIEDSAPVSGTVDALYELEPWDDTLDGEGDLDVNWENEEHEHETASNQSSTTLSSKISTKRSLSEAELAEYEDEPEPNSPGSKRPRVD